jgi:hypothetical protein
MRPNTRFTSPAVANMKNEASVEIDRDIEEVFRLTCDHIPEWSTIVVEDNLIEQTLDGVGTTFLTITEERGRRMEFQGVVTKYDPPFSQAVHLTGEFFDIDSEFQFVEIQGQTKVTQISSVAGKGMFRAFFFLFGWMMKKANCEASLKELNGLKAYCEGHTTNL